MRKALKQVDRGSERRQRTVKAPAHMERRKTNGRREKDDPNKSIW